MVTVTGGGSRRVSLAALIAVKAGQRPRLIFRVRSGRRRADRRKGFTGADYARLPGAARRQPGGPLVLVRDSLNTRVSKAMREPAAARDRLTVFRLPACASELNPAEPAWSLLKRSPASLARRSLAELAALARTRPRRMQYRPGLPGSFPARTRPDPAPLCNPRN